MTLDAYFKQPDARSLTELAALIGVSKGRLSQIRGGEKCTADLALRIEAATNGAISASELSHTIAQARAA
jgi:DNA-binding transcriptional regulator YdaS (Cro superfamily)